MSVFKRTTTREQNLSSVFDVTIATVKRNLITDWQYKSDIIIQFLWTVTNLIAYGFLGLSVGQGTGDFAPNYSFSLFLLSSSAFWTLFTGNYEETAFCLREESARGTMGYLITNNVDTLGIMIGRYLSSSLKFLIIFLVTTIPTFALIKGPAGNLLPHTAREFFMLIPFVLFSYLFMMCISVFMGSITLIVKQTTTIVRIMLYIIRILGGYFFMIESFAAYGGLWWLPVVFVCCPIVTGQYAFRRYLIEHDSSVRFPDMDVINNHRINKGLEAIAFPGLNYGYMLLINLAVCGIFLVGAYFFAKWLTQVARKRGTIEFY